MGNLFVVATPIGNLNDITLRAIETLKKVDIILCEDTRESMKLLNNFNIKKKLMSYHKFNEESKKDEIIKLLKFGSDIALISDAGTPCISDPGYILVKKAREEGIKVVPVGGISACITALSASGLETEKFTFYGFFPRDNKDKNKLIEDIKTSNINTYIFYESPKRIIKTLNYLKDNIDNITISVSKELTKIHEKNYFGALENVIKEITLDEKSSLGEYTFIIEKKELNKESNDKEILSSEALLIDKMVKNNISLKEAINMLKIENKELNKNEIYRASLNLKELFKS